MYQEIPRIPEKSFSEILDILPEPWILSANVFHNDIKTRPVNLKNDVELWNSGHVEIRLNNGTKEDILSILTDGREFFTGGVKEPPSYCIFKEAEFKHGSLNIKLTLWEIIISHNKAVEENPKEVIEFFLKINSIPDIKFMWSK